jgi:predicted RNase H-like nuclease (RuvC/YqgF family)
VFQYTLRRPALPDQHVEAEVISGKDIKTIESSLEALWDKARRVSEVLVQFRETNGVLRKKVQDLETVEQNLKQELAAKERELERLRQDALRLQSNGSNILTKEEKEALKARIKDLIGKINSHL